MSIITDLIDRTLELEPGQKIKLRLTSTNELKSVKVSLYRERKRYEEKLGRNAKHIIIRQEKVDSDSDIYYLYLFLSDSGHGLAAFGAEIIGSDGEAVAIPEDFVESVEEKEETEESEKGRIRRLMKEDGLSEEEIDQILKGE